MHPAVESLVRCGNHHRLWRGRTCTWQVRVRVARIGRILGRGEAGGGGDGALRELTGVPGAVAWGHGQPAGHCDGQPVGARAGPGAPKEGVQLLQRAPRLPGLVRG